jgi:hypothetical protein
MLLNLRRILGACSAALLLSYPLFCQTFAAPKNYGPFTDSFQLKAGDFNRDGAADLIGAANFNNGTQTHLVIYMNNGSGGFLTPAVIAGTTSAFAVSVGDFNQDGNLDVAFASGTSAQVGVAYGNGHGTFGTPIFYGVTGAPNSLAVGDYNGDGKPDIATMSDSTKEVTILTNTGSSFTSKSFAVPLYYKSQGYSGDAIAGLVAGDFNGNHKQDLAYTDGCTDANCGPVSRIYTLINSGSEIFTPNLLPDVVDQLVELTAADVDLDGKVDLLVFSEGAGYVAQAYVDYSNGNNSFTRVYMDDYQSSDGIPQNLVVGDFNNDGIEDVAGYTNTDGYGTPDYGFEVFTGKGGRSGFNAPVHYADNTTVSLRGGFAAGFFDQNGTKDVAVVDANGLAVFLNTTATTKDPCPYPTSTGLHNCSPANGGSGPSPVHILDSFKASAQPALRIEFWVDGHKVFQEYGDLLNTYVSMAAGTHQLSVVGVDATGKYIKSNTTYTVK